MMWVLKISWVLSGKVSEGQAETSRTHIEDMVDPVQVQFPPRSLIPVTQGEEVNTPKFIASLDDLL